MSSDLDMVTGETWFGSLHLYLSQEDTSQVSTQTAHQDWFARPRIKLSSSQNIH